MIDLHAHVLPGIDDGPRTMAESLDLLRALQDDGVQHVVATPHIYPGVYDNTPVRIAEVFATVREQAQAHGLSIMLSWGAEVRLCSEMLDWLSQDSLACLGKGTDGVRTVLIEMPDGQVPVGSDRLIARLVAKGFKPLLAHPERNRAVMESLSCLDPLLAAGAVVQLTAGSLLGDFGEKAQVTAKKLLDQSYNVAAVASDSHNLRARRPRLTAARTWLVENYGEAVALQLTETGPAQLVGIGQVIYAGPDGLVIRDLPVDAAPSFAQQVQSIALDDMPSPTMAADSKSTTLDINPTWNAASASSFENIIPDSLTDLSGNAIPDLSKTMQDLSSSWHFEPSIKTALLHDTETQVLQAFTHAELSDENSLSKWSLAEISEEPAFHMADLTPLNQEHQTPSPAEDSNLVVHPFLSSVAESSWELTPMTSTELEMPLTMELPLTAHTLFDKDLTLNPSTTAQSGDLVGLKE